MTKKLLTYNDLEDLVKRLRNNKVTLGHGEYGVDPLCEQAVDAIQELRSILEKQQVIIRRIYAEHLPNTWFVCGEHGQKDTNNLPQFIDVCPAYGAGWSQVYEKTDRTIMTEGS